MHDLHLETIGPYGDCAVIKAGGEVDVHTAPALRAGIRDLVDKGVRHVIVDASAVTFIDSTGLGVLVGGLKRLHAHEGELALATNQERIVRLCQLTGLARYFPPYKTVADAIGDNPHWRKAIEHEKQSIAEWCRSHDLI